MSTSTLLAVPNVSEGLDRAVIDEIGNAFDARMLDIHADPDHDRSVFTLAGAPGQLAPAVLAGAGCAVARIDVNRHHGAHPRVGSIDVAPIVYLEEEDRGAACAEALLLADLLGHDLELPVLLYGELAGGRTRAQLRRGGISELARKLDAGELRPDFGPRRIHPSAGAVLVSARPPLIALNVALAAPARLEDAREIAARIREGGAEGLESVRAIGLWLERQGVAQVSANVEDHHKTSPAEVVAAIRRHATAAEAELVGLAPRSAFREFPDDLPLRRFATIEDALGSATPPPP